MEEYRYVSWDTNITCQPELYFQPSSIEELREILQKARETNRRVKVCGSHHSFNTLPCTTGYLIDLKNLNRVLKVDPSKSTIRVQAGITLKQLSEDVLPKHGMALSVLGTAAFQSVAGAISTGTHGTGTKFQMVSSCMIDLEIMKSSGEIVRCSREDNPELFRAAQCGLGALGIITSATIQCEPAFKLHEKVTPMKFEKMIANLDEFVESGDHVQINVMPHTNNTTVTVWNRTKQAVTPVRKRSWFWDWLIGSIAFDILYYISTFVESLMPWINAAFFRFFHSRPVDRVADSYRVFEIPFPVGYGIEWAIPRKKTASVVQKLKELADAGSFYSQTAIFLRFSKADDIMLSTAYNRDVCHINVFHYMPFGRKSPNNKLWTICDDVTRSAGGICHWGKVVKPRPYAENKELFPMWEKFCDIRKNMDPDGIFLNDFLETTFNE